MQFVVKITVEKQDEEEKGAPQSDVRSALIEELETQGIEFEVDNSEGDSVMYSITGAEAK